MTGAVIPAVPGVLSAEQVAATGRAIAALQEPSGAIPWSLGEHTDVWNHVESAMGLLVAGQTESAERALEWCRRTQRFDGSWPMKIVAGEIEDHSSETNMSAYLAVGLWHHWLVRQDRGFVESLWPVVARALDFVVSLQLRFGGIAWSQEWDEQGPARVNAEALLAGSSSIFHALRAGMALAELVGERQPQWELAAGRLGHAIAAHPEEFLDKRTFSMDWYYPVLGGAVRGAAAGELIGARWADFVVPGLGVRCVGTNPWVTGAESCELVLALDAVGDRDRAVHVLADVQHLRHESDGYWTGFVFPDAGNQGGNWPPEQTTYTAAAVILAADALSETTGGSGIFRDGGLVPEVAAIGLECACADSSDRVAGYPAGTD